VLHHPVTGDSCIHYVAGSGRCMKECCLHACFASDLLWGIGVCESCGTRCASAGAVHCCLGVDGTMGGWCVVRCKTLSLMTSITVLPTVKNQVCGK
jgi:hypothetical protein